MQLARIDYEGCPLCDGQQFKNVLHANCRQHEMYSTAIPEMIDWVHCVSCEHVFTKGYFDNDSLGQILKTANYGQIFDVAIAENFREKWAPVVKEISGYLASPGGRFLDVGFGNGTLLMTAEEFGFSVVGIDLRQAAIDALSPYIGDLRRCDLLEMNDDGQFDVLSMADFIEHVPYPKPYIAKAHNLINPSGLLFLSTPNLSAPAWKVLTRHQLNPYWIEIEHFHNFSRERLVSLLAAHGFELLSYNISNRYRVGMDLIFRKI